MKLSVVMPVGRVDQFLVETLQSVNAQIFREFELILICDSNIYDSLLSLIITNNYSFLYKIIHTRLEGVAFAANLGIAASQSEYIARWDSDDLCTSNRFLCQIKFFESNPEISVIGTRVELIDSKNNIILNHKFKFYQDNKSIRFALKFRQPLLHSSLMFRSEVLFQNKGYMYGHASEDHELFIRIARNSLVRFANLPNVTTFYRRHSSQLSDLTSLHRHFYEIAGFMFSEFLKTGNLFYLIGMFANLPILRKIRYLYRLIVTKVKLVFL